MELNITCSTDDNYIQHCLAMLCSLYVNNSNNVIHTHLLHSGLSYKSQKLISDLTERYNNIVSFYDINDDVLKNVNRRVNSPVSIATYYRILLPSLLDSSIEKVFYLDCDVIVLRDISELFNIRLDGYGIAAIKDCSPFNNQHREIMGMELDDHAFCAGVMMINLKYWRENNCQKQLLDYSNTKQPYVYLEDQDALNYVFYKHWFQLPYKFGKTPLSFGVLDDGQRFPDYYENAYEPSIIHYAAHVKPWLNVWFPERKYYWKYVKLSGYLNPKITKVSLRLKWDIYKTTLRYIVNKNIRPFIPDFIEIILLDIYRLFKLIVVIFNPTKFKKFLLSSWLHKYGHLS